MNYVRGKEDSSKAARPDSKWKYQQLQKKCCNTKVYGLAFRNTEKQKLQNHKFKCQPKH